MVLELSTSTATTVRNAPCPCGSGRKFKHCCGALPLSPEAGPTISAAMPPAARSLLIRGLRHQIDAEFEAACELYRAALVAAPGDPEILHMLAIAEYSLHDMAGAEVHLLCRPGCGPGRSP